MTLTPTRPQAGDQMDFLLWLFRPLLTVDEARYLLREPSPQTVTRRLDDGSLRGVDISTGGDAAGRRELRIYRWSVEWLYAPATLGRPLPEVFDPAAIIPHALDILRRDEVAKLLNCEPRHVANLTAERLLYGPRLSAGASAASADRTPRVTRRSLMQFLTDREVRP